MITLGSNLLSISILFFATSLAVYFFLTMGKFPITLNIFLFGIGMVHFLVAAQDDVFWTMALFYFYSLDGIYRILKPRSWIVLTVGLLLSLLSLTLHDHNQLPVKAILVLLALYILAARISMIVTQREEMRQLYDQLRGEYRKVKRLNLAAERDARLEERTKIARDIHDSVGHRLTALIMKLEMLSIQRKTEDYTELKRMASESLEETRQAVRALNIEENEGIATVVHLIRKLEAESHIMVQFTVKQGVLSASISNDKSVALYRVIQEALTNAMRHAQTREVRVTLGKSATGAIAFEIENSLHKATSFKEGFGISMMRKRVGELGGSLEVIQTNNKFVVSGMIPSEG